MSYNKVSFNKIIILYNKACPITKVYYTIAGSTTDAFYNKLYLTTNKL
jgi:hypothetical protein